MRYYPILKPNASEAVSRILASYDHLTKRESLQGKPHCRSGCYDDYDTVLAPPEVRWPYEGFHWSNGKKYLLYGEIAMPQWMTDQLTNILQVKDHNTIKQALIPVIAATEDAASILFTAEKNSRACSMQKMEEGNLAWGDST